MRYKLGAGLAGVCATLGAFLAGHGGPLALVSLHITQLLPISRF